MKLIQYRNENYHGAKEHTPLEILKYETINLENAWMLLTSTPVEFPKSLTKRILEFVKDVEEKLEKFPDEIEWEEGSEVTNELEETYSELLQEVLDEINQYYGTEINYLMWLGDLDVVLWDYIDNFDDIENALKAYKTGYLILEDVTGNLYGYKEKPVPVENGAIEKLKELRRG